MNDAFLSQEIIHNCADMCSSCVMRTSEVDLGMVSMFGRTGAPTKRGPPQARECRTPARHFRTCGVGPIYAVLRHLKLESSRGAELHSLACGLWVGGSVCRIANLKLCARNLEIELE